MFAAESDCLIISVLYQVITITMTTASVYTMPWRVSIGFACALKSKGSLFALMLPLRSFNIHGAFPRFFMVENGSSDFKSVLQTKGKNR